MRAQIADSINNNIQLDSREKYQQELSNKINGNLSFSILTDNQIKANDAISMFFSYHVFRCTRYVTPD